ncbi:MAG TPA: FecR domain-containing protein [Steroidobacteraceae bacterium]|jgi:transmembrane sensor|nr:FecR domain-containing protein [Steroidobacteraceae bacterium]
MSLIRQPVDHPVPSNQARAEAAVWIARLRDERGADGLDAEFHEWLGENEHHRRAFDRMTQAWEQAGKIRMRARDDIPAIRSAQGSRFSPWAAASAATLVLAVIITAIYWRDDALVTGIGQRQVRLLQDGTRVVLNTDTRIEVNYDEHLRRVRLVRGEAWFEVSKRPSWPFVVSVGGEEIRALGTSFIVRHDNDQDLSVTLVDGRISVAPVAGDGDSAQAARILAPGQRLIVAPHQVPSVDRPELSRVTAWERGRVEFDETPLADAAAEMNRYNTKHVAVPDPELARLRIGGVFRAGDSDEFVKIVTTAFGLRADRNGRDIVLSRPATQASPPAVR